MKTEALITALILAAVTFIGNTQGDQADSASQSQLQPLQAEKQLPESPCETCKDCKCEECKCDVNARLQIVPEVPLINAPAEKDSAQLLYDEAMQFMESGGRQWVYRVNGRLASRDATIEHLVRDHEMSRDDLERFDMNTLRWIHGMKHEESKGSAGEQSQGRWMRVRVCGKNGCRYEYRWVPR